MPKIEVFSRNVYGVAKIYPANDAARRFARLIGAKIFSRTQLVEIEVLGNALNFKVEQVPDPAALIEVAA